VRSDPTVLAFHAASVGLWQLLTGNRAGNPPEYDLAPLRGALTHVGGDQLTPGPQQENPNYIPPPILPGVETAGAPIDLTKWSRRRRLETASSGVVRIELDAGILAASRSDLGDIRLVQDGRQIPYLVRPDTQVRELKPAGFVSKDDPKRPNTSRWEITLPVTGLPVVNLGADSTANLFERRFVATTERKDSQGNAWTEELGRANWTKPGNAEPPLVLNLRGSRLPATFFLETDHGDNTPIPVDDVIIRYAAPSIAAKLTSGAPVFLCYGNPQAVRPQYDLRLVGHELMAAEQATATLGDEELLRPKPKQPLIMDAGSPFLWIALAAVVAVLLVVVAKLLPRDAASEVQ
jgi:hypothetical protein